MMIFSILLTCLFFACGCATHPKQFTAEDKRESMIGMKNARFLVNPNRASSTGKTAEIITSPQAFIEYKTAAIINGDDLSNFEFAQEAVQGPILTHNLTMKALDESAYDGVVQGHAALISEDGYFLTAAHVVENKDSLIIFKAVDYVEPAGSTVEIKYLILPVRKVFMDDASDFAIIKANIDSLYSFTICRQNLKMGEKLLSGGWFSHGPTSGKLVNGPDTLSTDPLIQEYSTTAPGIEGDSGSGVFNSGGELLGVLTSGNSRNSFFSMMDIDSLNEIIQADRAKSVELAKQSEGASKRSMSVPSDLCRLRLGTNAPMVEQAAGE